MSNIINLQHYTDALRNTGYKNVESAVAEIVDNSIEAGAKDVLLICNIDASSGKKVIKEFGFLDNGTGMTDIILQSALCIGESTRRARKGMGRFGVGLPQASMHVAPRVEVYTWRESEDVRMVYLDVSEIKEGKQTQIDPPSKSKLPEIYLKYLKECEINGRSMKFDRGTLVVWKNCDRLCPRTVLPLFTRFKKLLGRKFRYFITNNKCHIGLTVVNTDKFDVLLKPNDPLNLMKDNLILGDTSNPKNTKEDGEPIFELWSHGNVLGSIEHPIDYVDKDGKKASSNIEITFSLAKEDFQKAGGESKIGQHCKSHVGISIVRAHREIDFGKFDFFEDINEPQHRWWGCEIKFNPELDEAFGVANNKQQVELYSLDPFDYYDDEVKPVWLQLEKLISNEIKAMYKALRARKKGSRTQVKIVPEEQIVSELEKNNFTITRSKKIKEETPQYELEKLIEDKLISNGNPTPSHEEVTRAMLPLIKLEYKDIGDTSTFMDVSTRMGNCWLTINTGSVFYRNLYSKIEDKDEDIKRAFNLILMAFARAEDEAYKDKVLFEAFRDVRELWGQKLRKYLNTDFQA